MLRSQFFHRFLTYYHFIDQITLVAQYDDLASNLTLLSDLFEPVARVLKAILIGDIIHKDDPRCLPVLLIGQRSKLDIARGVPYVHLDAVTHMLNVLLL